jgi:hypothetical protein
MALPSTLGPTMRLHLQAAAAAIVAAVVVAAVTVVAAATVVVVVVAVRRVLLLMLSRMSSFKLLNNPNPLTISSRAQVL